MATQANKKSSDASGFADPCGTFGPTQWWAVVWFISVIIIGSELTILLAKSDHWMYEHNGEFLDYRAYHENRRATTTLGVERVDERAHADYLATTSRLRQSSKAE